MTLDLRYMQDSSLILYYVICENLLNVTRKCECEGFIKFRSLTYPPILISLKSFSGATRRRLQLGPRAPGNQRREVSRPLELRGGQLSFLQQIERIISRSHGGSMQNLPCEGRERDWQCGSQNCKLNQRCSIVLQLHIFPHNDSFCNRKNSFSKQSFQNNWVSRPGGASSSQSR